MTRETRRRPSDSTSTRRSVLSSITAVVSGIGLIHSVRSADAFSRAKTNRGSQANVANDSDSVVGLLLSDSVKRNSQTLLTEVTNNTAGSASITVELSDCTQGTLFAPDGSSGCAVTFPLQSGGMDSVDIETGEAGGTTIPFTIKGWAEGGAVTFTIARSTSATSGNTGGVTVDRIKKFAADTASDQWTIGRFTASSTDYELDRIELEISEAGSGTTVATRTISSISGFKYDAKGKRGNPAVTISPTDSGYNVSQNTTYELIVTAYNTNGDFGRDSRTA